MIARGWRFAPWLFKFVPVLVESQVFETRVLAEEREPRRVAEFEAEVDRRAWEDDLLDEIVRSTGENVPVEALDPEGRAGGPEGPNEKPRGVVDPDEEDDLTDSD